MNTSSASEYRCCRHFLALSMIAAEHLSLLLVLHARKTSVQNLQEETSVLRGDRALDAQQHTVTVLLSSQKSCAKAHVDGMLSAPSIGRI
jgi:hypothetical protein